MGGEVREKSGWERKRENWMEKCLGEKKVNKKAASGIYGLEIRYSPKWTAAYRLKPQQHRAVSSLSSPQNLQYGYAHYIIHSHNNYYYNSQAQPFRLNLWRHHLRLHKMTLYKNAIVQYRGYFAMGEPHYLGDKHNASLWHWAWLINWQMISYSSRRKYHEIFSVMSVCW